jgi:hypothetical protein
MTLFDSLQKMRIESVDSSLFQIAFLTFHWNLWAMTALFTNYLCLKEAQSNPDCGSVPQGPSRADVMIAARRPSLPVDSLPEEIFDVYF